MKKKEGGGGKYGVIGIVGPMGEYSYLVPTAAAIPGSSTSASMVTGQPVHRKNKRRKRPPMCPQEFAGESPPLPLPLSPLPSNVARYIPDLYELTTEVLGKGARSCVTTAVRRSTGKQFAVKVVPKTSEREREKVLREVEILYLCRENEYVVSSVLSL